jgi:PAS domain-containing protein
MNLQTLERIKQQWRFAADSTPQLICRVDRDGRVMHANRTLERWKLGEVETSSRDFSHALGLQRMKERAELSGGDYEFRSAPGQGTRIRVRWPALQAPERAWMANPQPLVESMGKLPLPDREMPDRYLACLACMRSLRST